MTTYHLYVACTKAYNTTTKPTILHTILTKLFMFMIIGGIIIILLPACSRHLDLLCFWAGFLACLPVTERANLTNASDFWHSSKLQCMTKLNSKTHRK